MVMKLVNIQLHVMGEYPKNLCINTNTFAFFAYSKLKH